MGTPGKKGSKKKVTWDEKLVHRPNTSGTTMTRFKETQTPQKKVAVNNVKSILKGCPNPG